MASDGGTSGAGAADGGTGLRVGRYELLSRLAAGGMGEVFIARPTRSSDPDERVAVKLLLPHLSERPEFVQMFLDEARIAARMNHPNVVRIFDLGESEGRYYVAMTLVEGVSLSALMHACREERMLLSLPVARLVAQGLCAALMHAHNLREANGKPFHLIHRDVTPHNVLISTSGQVVLTDFGIAKASDNLHHTRTGVVRGKYAYIAPEQLSSSAGVKVDQRADLFSAAVTLFEAYTLVSPFAREDERETMEAIKTGEVPDLLSLRTDVTAELKAAFERGLERNPERRYQTARELSEALVTGPLAKPEELGNVVQVLCPKDLRAFLGDGRATTTTDSSRFTESGTASIGLVSDTLGASGARPLLRPRKKALSPIWVIAGLALLAFGAAAAFAWSSLSSDFELQEVDHPLVGPVPNAFRTEPPPEQPGEDEPAHPAAPAASGEPTEAKGPHAPGGSSDTGSSDTGSSDTGSSDTGSSDTGSSDTGSSDTGAAATTGAAAGTAPDPTAARTEPAVEADGLDEVAAPLRVGYLSAEATPWADLTVDGAHIERTPLSRYPLQAGAHLVVFRHPGLPKVERRITIEEGQVSRVRVSFPRR